MTLDQFLKKHPYLTAMGIANKSGVSYQSIRLEIAGKYSSAERLQAIEAAIHKIGEELQKIKLTSSEA
jgi:hypothetical protein